MKWKISVLGIDTKESQLKLNVREDSDKLFEIIPKVFIDIIPDDVNEGDGDVQCKSIKGTRVSSAVSGNQFGIAVESQFIILNSTLDGIDRTLEFDSLIDFVLWRRSVLLIGLSSSKVMLINPNTLEILEEKALSTRQITDKEFSPRFFVDAFLNSNPNPSSIDVCAIAVDGTVYAFSDVSLSVGSLETTIDENCSIDIDLNTIKGTVKRFVSDTEVVAVCSAGRKSLITADKKGVISAYSIFDHNPLLSDFFISANLFNFLEIEHPVSIKKMLRLEGILFILLSNGRLEFVLDEMLIPLRTFTMPSTDDIVQDFEIVYLGTDIIKLWILFSNLKSGDHFIGIADGPNFNLDLIMHIITVAEDSKRKSIFQFPASSFSDEPNVFIQIMPDGSTKVYRMEEFSTEISLQRLLHEGKFEDAEKLALCFSVDLDIIRRARIQSEFTKLSLAENATEEEAAFKEFSAILQTVNDHEYVCSIAADTKLPRLDWLAEVLKIGLKRVGECSGSKQGKRLLTVVKKFYTFQQVLPEAGIREWNEFTAENTSMFLQCLVFLHNLQFEKSERVWLRHADEFMADIELPDFAPFFTKLFSKRLETEDGLSLFKTIFPYALEKCECETEKESQSKVLGLLSLINTQIRILEREQHWQENGIRFIQALIGAVEEESRKLHGEKDYVEAYGIMRRLNTCEDILRRIRNILQALTELQELKHGHSLRIGYDTYIMDSKIDVINSVLSLIFSREEVEVFVKQFLTPFVKRNGFVLDDILVQHINLFSADVPYFSTSGSIPFEDRLLTLVELIESDTARLQSILAIIQEWPVPWYSLMDEVVQRAIQLNVSHDPVAVQSQKTIQVRHLQVPFRCILQKYRLTAVKFHIGYNLSHTVKRILKSKKENCFQDCLELIKHTGKYDENSVRLIKLWYELAETTVPIDVLLGSDLSPTLMHRLLVRIVEQFRRASKLLQSDEVWSRLSECGRILASRLGDERLIQFFELRKLLNTLYSDDILYSPYYPFSALQLLLEENHQQEVAHLMNLSSKLSKISFTPYKDLLLVVASFYSQNKSQTVKLLSFVNEIIMLPGSFHTVGDVVPNAGVRIAHSFLLCINADTSTKNLDSMDEFLKQLLISYSDHVIQPVVKIKRVLSIILELRDKEIPFEEKFLKIYKEACFEGFKNCNQVSLQLKELGESLLRFGDIDLLCQIFATVHQEYLSQYCLLDCESGQSAELFEGATKVEELKNNLIENIANFHEDDKNLRVVHLVKVLHAAGLTLNPYALRHRNKACLIKKLVEMNEYQLGAQVGLIFDFWHGPSWSTILSEYISEGKIEDLKGILASLKRVSEVWVLPEFKEAWILVSKKYPTFAQMCPIPLTISN